MAKILLAWDSVTTTPSKWIGVKFLFCGLSTLPKSYATDSPLFKSIVAGNGGHLGWKDKTVLTGLSAPASDKGRLQTTVNLKSRNELSISIPSGCHAIIWSGHVSDELSCTLPHCSPQEGVCYRLLGWAPGSMEEVDKCLQSRHYQALQEHKADWESCSSFRHCKTIFAGNLTCLGNGLTLRNVFWFSSLKLTSLSVQRRHIQQ